MILGVAFKIIQEGVRKYVEDTEKQGWTEVNFLS